MINNGADEMDNSIKTWRQGAFIDQRQYSKLGEDWKREREREERLLVRPSETGNAICQASSPDQATWIASRLNLASELEQMTYDFATGKTDGSELIAFVQKKVA
jgi:ribosomal protein L18